jgi:hypothetical protein
MTTCTIKSLLFITLFALNLTSTASAQVYVIGDFVQASTARKFGLLNPKTGAYTFIGTTSVDLGGLGFAADGNLYGFGYDSELYRINTATAALTEVGNTGVSIGNGFGMGAAQDGTLYAVFQRDKFYKINPINGEATFIGIMNFDSGCCPAGDAAGNLYDAQATAGSGFYKIDTATGEGTLLGNATYGIVGSLVYTNNTMYAFNLTGSIYTMNLTDGQSTQIATYDPSVVGRIYAGAVLPIPVTGAVPEPGSLALWIGLLVPGAALLIRRR